MLNSRQNLQNYHFTTPAKFLKEIKLYDGDNLPLLDPFVSLGVLLDGLPRLVAANESRVLSPECGAHVFEP